MGNLKEKIKTAYETGEGSFQHLADKYGAKVGTIKSWSKRDKDEGNQWIKIATKEKTKKKKVATKAREEKVAKKEVAKKVAKEIKIMVDNNELNDRQKLFCIIYAKRQNATKAYQRVYRCTYGTAMTNGSLLLRNPKIRAQVDRLMEFELNNEFLKKGLIQQYKDIAFSDIGDYLEFGKKLIPQWTKNDKGKDTPIIDPNTGEQKIKEYSYVDLKDSIGLDTSLLTEVSEGKDGIKFKLADKMKAMDVLSKLSNLLSDGEKTKLDLEYKVLQNSKLRVDIEKAKNDNLDDDIEYIVEGGTNEDKKEN